MMHFFIVRKTSRETSVHQFYISEGSIYPAEL